MTGGARLTAVVVAVLVVVSGCVGGDDDGSSRDPSAGPQPTTSDTVAGTSTPGDADSEGVVVGEQVKRALVEAATDDGLVRWPGGAVTVGWSGAVTLRDEQILLAAAEQLAGLTGLRLVPTGAGSVDDETDIAVVFAPRREWPVAPEVGTADLLGVTEARWTAGGELTGATVAIDSTIDQSLRNQTIVHELVHAVGVGHVTCPTSIIYGGTDGIPTWTLGALDDALLRTWYDADLPAGQSAGDLERVVQATSGGPVCEPAPFVVVQSDLGVLWCETGSGVRACVVVDGLGEPPSSPITEPDRWVQDRTLYDYDPSRYEAVQIDGRRALCELTGGERRPCQFTDGPGPLTGADVWTDGTYVYPSP